VHIPELPPRLQDLQVPWHKLSQQTPSIQLRVAHSGPLMHPVPTHLLQYVPPQSTSVSSPFFMPSLHEIHTLSKQRGLVPVVQLPSLTHSTHVPLLSHTPPGHVVPTGAIDVEHVMDAQTGSKQGTPVAGQSIAVIHDPGAPLLELELLELELLLELVLLLELEPLEELLTDPLLPLLPVEVAALVDPLLPSPPAPPGFSSSSVGLVMSAICTQAPKAKRVVHPMSHVIPLLLALVLSCSVFRAPTTNLQFLSCVLSGCFTVASCSPPTISRDARSVLQLEPELE